MKTKYFSLDMLQEGKYYYLEGEYPEVMSLHRVLRYAKNILNANEGELPFELEMLTDNVCSLDKAKKVIDWFGEELYELKIPSQSIDFINAA